MHHGHLPLISSCLLLWRSVATPIHTPTSRGSLGSKQAPVAELLLGSLKALQHDIWLDRHADRHRRNGRTVSRQGSMTRRWWYEPERPRPGAFRSGSSRWQSSGSCLTPRLRAVRISLTRRRCLGDAMAPRHPTAARRRHLPIQSRCLRLHGLDAVWSVGLLVGHRAEFQLDLLGEVAARLRQCRWIGEQQVRRAGQGIDLTGQPMAGALRGTARGGDDGFECRMKVGGSGPVRAAVPSKRLLGLSPKASRADGRCGASLTLALQKLRSAAKTRLLIGLTMRTWRGGRCLS